MLATACGGTTQPKVVDATTVAPDFGPTELRVLRVLGGADPRIALRTHVEGDGSERDEAALQEMIGSEGTTHSVGTVLDPFAFAARERALGRAEGALTEWSQGLRSASAPPKSAPTKASPVSELELLRRFVSEERLRLVRESELPRGASALVRGLMKTYAATKAKPSPETMDGWLHDRLERIRASLAKPLSSAERQELDDALDPLEHLLAVNPAGKAMAALARLRVDLTSAGAQSEPAARARDLALTLTVYFGESRTAEQLKSAFEDARRTLPSPAVPAKGHADASANPLAAVLSNAGAGDEGAKVAGSILRSSEPSPERAPATRLVAALAAMPLAEQRALLHDALVVGAWSIDLANEAKTVSGPRLPRPHTAFAPAPETEERLTRHISADPSGALAVALVAERFARAPEASWSSLAARLQSLGDLPWDVAVGQLGETSPARVK